MSGKFSVRRTVSVLFLAAGPFLIAFICMGFGRFSLTPGRTLTILSSPLTGVPIETMESSVVFRIRLPRILLAALAGAAMSCSGIAFQNMFNNPMATPDTLGVTSGASFGAALAIMMRMNLVGIQLTAMLFGLGAVLITWNISRVKGKNTIIMIILSGMVVSSLFEALVSLLKYTADPEEVLPTITYWLMGSLAGANYSGLSLGAPPIIAGVIIIFLLRWRLNILSLSEDEARSMGINLRLMRLLVIAAATMMTASVVSMCGKIGWIGLLIPHISRMVFGGNNQRVVPASISFGAMFTLLIDTVARSASSAEIPVSILTAIIGAPVFISLLRKTGGIRS